MEKANLPRAFFGLGMATATLTLVRLARWKSRAVRLGSDIDPQQTLQVDDCKHQSSVAQGGKDVAELPVSSAADEVGNPVQNCGEATLATSTAATNSECEHSLRSCISELEDDDAESSKYEHNWHQPAVCRTRHDRGFRHAVSSTLVVVPPEALLDHFHSGFLDATEETQSVSRNPEAAEVGEKLCDDAFCEVRCSLSSPSRPLTGPGREARNVDETYLGEKADRRPPRGASRAQELVQRVLRRLDTLEEGRAAEAASHRHEARAARDECMQAARCLTRNVVRRALQRASANLFENTSTFADEPRRLVQQNEAAAQYTLEQLTDPQTWRRLGLDPKEREKLLPDAVFRDLFGMDRAAFAGLPLWRRESLKKQVGLF